MLGRRLLAAFALAVVVTGLLSFRLSRPALHVDELTYMKAVLASMVQGTVLPAKENGRPFVNKPPLALWLMRGSFQVLGPSPLAARLPSALAGAATAVVVYLYAAAVFGEAVAILAALILALTPGLLRAHAMRSATPDALEILLVTGAIVCLELRRRGRGRWTVVCLVLAAAAAAWTKSPFSLIVIVGYALSTEPFARRAQRSTPRFAAMLLLVALAWVAAFGAWLVVLGGLRRPGVVTRQLFRQQYLQRIEGRYAPSHAQGPTYYLRTLAGDFGVLLLLPLAAAAAARWRTKPGWRPAGYDVASLACWSAIAPALASLSVNKLPWYVFVSYPGIALTLAVSARQLAGTAESRWRWPALVLGCCLALGARVPLDEVWPGEARDRSPTGRLWEIAWRDPRVGVVPASGLRIPRRSAGREAGFFVDSLLYRQARRPPVEESCRAVLVNRPPPGGAGAALELVPAERGSPALYVLDRCGGRLLERLR